MSTRLPTKTEFLDPILGHPLSAIVFVEDYVQLQFSNATLNAYTLPKVFDSEGIFAAGDHGWRDSLCSRIGQLVSSVMSTECQLSMEFSDGAIIRGPEAIEFAVEGSSTIVVI
jgi:hypothetical protein